jgi:hypothetical protein
MPTEEEKQAEKERVTKISGFVLARTISWLRWTSMHLRLAMTDGRPNIATLPVKNGSTKSCTESQLCLHEESGIPYPDSRSRRAQSWRDARRDIHVIDEAGGWAGGAARQNSMEAWHLVFRPDLLTLLQVVELTEDSLK